MSRTRLRALPAGLWLVAVALACRAAALPPSATVQPASAPPTAAPASLPLATVTPTALAATAIVADDTAAIGALVDAMQQAVLAGDRAAYLALVDLSDPVFALEHTRWADAWSRAPLLAEYALEVADLRYDDHAATADLSVTWRTVSSDEPAVARFPVRFTRGPTGAWRYAGELWVDVETEHFLVRAAPGLEAASEAVQAALPSVYAHVTRSLDYVPASRMQIKLYATVEALVATTLLSLPSIHGWNEPGEALKLFAGSDAALEGALAHEFTHYIEFDQAGTARSRMPWWLSEGLAAYVADDYASNPQQREQLQLVAEWAASGELAPWESLSVFETTPQSLWRYVYPQGYAFVTFVTEVYGVEQRNAWVRAMATEMDLDAATPAVLGLSFEALDAEFHAWLAAHST